MGRRILFAIAVMLSVSAMYLPSLWATTGRTVISRVSASGADRAADAARRVRPALETDLAALGLKFGAPVFLRVFKREKLLELWVRGNDQRYVLFRDYPICAYSGELGPKLRQGDGQAPEGFYRVSAGQLNPRSQYHLSFNLGYPNAYDRAHGRTGDFLMVHGACVSIGCYAMGDQAIEEIYTLVAAALGNGQAAFEVHALPFRLDAANVAAENSSPWFAFWNELKPAYDAFERERRLPRIGVRDTRYVIGES